MDQINIDIHPDVDCVVRLGGHVGGRSIQIMPAGEHRQAPGPDAIGRRFVKCSASGRPLPDDSNGHFFVKDLQTGLWWSADTLGDERVNHKRAAEIAAGVTLSGHNDWRLPTLPELQSLVDLERYDPAIDTQFFPDTRSAAYWSSSPFAADPDCAWIVDFHNGGCGGYPRGYDGAFVRAVRGPVAASQ